MPTVDPVTRPSTKKPDVITDHIEGVEDGAEDEQAEEAPEAEQEDEPVVDSTTVDEEEVVPDSEEVRRRREEGVGNPLFVKADLMAGASALAVVGLIASGVMLPFTATGAIILASVVAAGLGLAAIKDIMNQRRDVKDYLAEGELDETSEEFSDFTPYQKHLARHKNRQKDKQNKKDYKFLSKNRMEDKKDADGTVIQKGVERKLKEGIITRTFQAGAVAGGAIAGIGAHFALSALGPASIAAFGASAALLPFAVAAAVAFVGFKVIDKWNKGRIAERKTQVREAQNRLIGQKLEERRELIDADIEDMDEEIQELQDDIDVAESENQTIDEILRTEKEDGEEIDEARRRQLKRQKANNQETIDQNNETLYGLEGDEDGGLVDDRDALIDERKAIDEDLDAIENADDLEDIDFKSDTASERKSELEDPKHVKQKYREQKLFGMQTVTNIKSGISQFFGAAVRSVGKKLTYFVSDEYREKRDRQIDAVHERRRKSTLGAAPKSGNP